MGEASTSRQRADCIGPVLVRGKTGERNGGGGVLALRSDVCCGDGTRCHSDGGGASLTLHEGGSLEGRVEAQVWLMTPSGSHCVSWRATGSVQHRQKKSHPIKVLCSPEKGENTKEIGAAAS